MTLFQGMGASPSEHAEALCAVLLLFGAVGDYSLGNDPGFGPRAGSLAAAIGQTGGCSPEDREALYFAGILHGIGALGNGGLGKSDSLPARSAMMERWNIPAAGARMCEQIPALPADTADIVRWHCEAWDGTGYPDQLRWYGIPKAAQFLHLAEAFIDSDDPDDALAKINEGSGRAFSPGETRTFTMWFHTNGGEIDLLPPPAHALNANETSAGSALALLSAAIDAHTGTPGRAGRIARNAAATASVLKLSDTDKRLLNASAYLFGIGEIAAQELEVHQFDPLAALGREVRATNAIAAAELLATLPAFEPLVPILRARAEWFDGTGRPDRLRSEAIPVAARILSVCLAHDALDEMNRTRIRNDRSSPLERLETASGTQFDPAIVRAFTEGLKAKA